MTPAPTGEFVFYHDYKALLQELTNLRVENLRLKALDAESEENDAWQSLKLTAGDSLKLDPCKS